MKTLLRAFLYHVFALFVAALINPGFKIAGGIKYLALSGAIFALLNFVVKPILKIVFFPINLLTLGIFAWVINVAIIYVLMYFVPQIRVYDWTFLGFAYSGFSIPTIHFTKLMSVILTSFLVSLLISALNWLRK